MQLLRLFSKLIPKFGRSMRIRICLFSYLQKIQYEKYKLKSNIMKNKPLSSIIVSYINIVVNQTDAYNI